MVKRSGGEIQADWTEVYGMSYLGAGNHSWEAGPYVKGLILELNVFVEEGSSNYPPGEIAQKLTSVIYKPGTGQYDLEAMSTLASFISDMKAGGQGSSVMVGKGVKSRVGNNNWIQNAQIGLGAFDLANGAKEELINYAAKSDAAINEMKYVKAVKVASKGLFGAQALISTYQTYDAFSTDNENAWGVAGKAGLDITMGALSTFGGPIGWGLGAAYFIGDAAGWWGNWGQPALAPPNINRR